MSTVHKNISHMATWGWSELSFLYADITSFQCWHFPPGRHCWHWQRRHLLPFTSACFNRLLERSHQILHPVSLSVTPSHPVDKQEAFTLPHASLVSAKTLCRPYCSISVSQTLPSLVSELRQMPCFRFRKAEEKHVIAFEEQSH